MDFLSRREYSRFELAQKLTRKSFESIIIDAVLLQLQIENLLSDQRFVESFVHSRIHKGYGPLHIQQALRQRGITGELLEQALENNDENWTELACRVRQKRFGDVLPKNWQEKIKQSRFLRYRGFSSVQIEIALKKESDVGN